MKRIMTLTLAVMVMIGASGCGKVAAEEKATPARSVTVQTVQEVEKPASVTYIGTVNAKDIVKYSFKTPGKIAEVYVEKGQKVSKGTALARLDQQELKFQYDAATAKLAAAKATARQAESALNYDNEYLTKMEELLKAQAISQDQYDKLVLKASVSKDTYSQAVEQISALQTDCEYKNYLLQNALLVAESDGVVVDVIQKESEQIAAYYPVVALRSVTQVVNVGIAQDDLDQLKVGTKAVVEMDGQTANATITQIAEIPDEATRTYNAEITVADGVFQMGTIAKVKFATGMAKGIWVPMDSVLSEGESYVFVVQKERVFKRVVEIQSIHDSSLMVSGLQNGEQVVVNGMKNLNDGMKVQVSEQ